MRLTPPGEVYQGDFRHFQSPPPPSPTLPTLKLLQWNIERGYKLPGIIEELKRIDADIISLQEVDVGCDRSDGADTGVAIAQALGLNYVFFSEFEEIRSPVRNARIQGGGVHGNAILTKFDISDVQVVQPRLHPVDWNDPTDPIARREPRRGQRAVLRATLQTPQGPLVVYCAHFEVFCGMLARITQLADIFADTRSMIDKGYQNLAILGDLNTMAHGIARLSPSYCRDRMRLRTLGSDEAVVWERSVIAIHDAKYSNNGLDNNLIKKDANDNYTQNSTAFINTQLLDWGLGEEVARDALNPGFSCPFPAASTVTLDNPTYKWFGVSFMRGKLDWTLLRGVHVIDKQLGNDDYTLSDHRWLLVEGTLDKQAGS